MSLIAKIALVPALPIDEVLGEAASSEELLDGVEVSLGPALEAALFPDGAPLCVDASILTAALARSLEALDADRARIAALDVEALRLDLERIAARDGERLQHADVTTMLRALRDAARRQRLEIEARLASGSGLGASSGAVVRRLVRLVRLWSLATTWHAIAAHQIDDRAGFLMDVIAERWQQIEESLLARVRT